MIQSKFSYCNNCCHCSPQTQMTGLQKGLQTRQQLIKSCLTLARHSDWITTLNCERHPVKKKTPFLHSAVGVASGFRDPLVELPTKNTTAKSRFRVDEPISCNYVMKPRGDGLPCCATATLHTHREEPWPLRHKHVHHAVAPHAPFSLFI